MHRLPPRCSLALLEFQSESVPAIDAEVAALALARRRLHWLPMRPREEHLRRAGTSALFSLDTPGYNQGTSGLDALWAGLPLVTLPLHQWCERMGAGLVNYVGQVPTGVHSLRAMDDMIVALAGGVTASTSALEGRWRIKQGRGRGRMAVGIEVT